MAAQKKLFFNLRRLKGRLDILDNGDLAPDEAARLAERLDVTETELVDMNRRMAARDTSLNAPVADSDSLELQDTIVDDSPSPEALVAEREAVDVRSRVLREALGTLSDRERHIFVERRLRDDPPTLEDLGREYGISRERIRQLEARAFNKVKAAVENTAEAVWISPPFPEEFPDDADRTCHKGAARGFRGRPFAFQRRAGVA